MNKVDDVYYAFSNARFNDYMTENSGIFGLNKVAYVYNRDLLINKAVYEERIDLVVHENQKQAIIMELQDIIKSSNSPSETKEEPQNESFLIKLFRRLV